MSTTNATEVQPCAMVSRPLPLTQYLECKDSAGCMFLTHRIHSHLKGVEVQEAESFKNIATGMPTQPYVLQLSHDSVA